MIPAWPSLKTDWDFRPRERYDRGHLGVLRQSSTKTCPVPRYSQHSLISWESLLSNSDKFGGLPRCVDAFVFYVST